MFPIPNTPRTQPWAHCPEAQETADAVMECRDQVLALVQDLPRLEVLEGEELTLGRGNGASPRVTFRRRDDGGLDFPGSSLSLSARSQRIIPLPRPDSRQDAPPFREFAHRLLQDCQEFYAMYLTILRWEDTIPHLPLPEEKHPRDAAFHAVRQVCRQQPTGNLDPAVTQMQQALRSLLDPGIWEAACRATLPAPAQSDPRATLTAHRYNAAARLGPHLDDLACSNPGALAWGLAHLEQEPQDHRDLTRAAREHTLAAGLEPQAWRRLATLPAPLLAETLDCTDPQDLAQAVNIMHHAAAVPRPTILQAAADMLRECRETLQYSRRPQALVYRDNLHRLVLLLFRASEAGIPDNDLLDQAQEALDHARQCQEPSRNTTWNGLLKAAQRWHREHQQRQEARQFPAGPNPAPWDSLLPTAQREGLTIIPLTTPEMLRQEGLSMRHCCSTYAARCSRGERRIFSVRRPGEPRPLATGEIALRNGAWQAVQVRGYRNHTASPEAQEAIRQTAVAYQEAWRRTPAGQQTQEDPLCSTG